MRIRLFLTSVLAVIAVCPAFADPVIGPTQNEASCSGNTINNEQPGGTVTYVADWSPLECEITLDSNLANGAATQSSLTLYARYADGAYRSSTDRTNSSNKMTTNAYGLETTPGNLTLPTGATVTTTYTAHLPGSHTLSEVGSWPVTAPATTKSGSRALKGYYSAPTNGTAYIGGTSPYTPYYITTAGNTEASSIVADPNGDGTTCTPTTWFAQWDCVDSPLPNLTLTGYTFDGWYTDFAYETSATGTCVVADRTVHAKWTAKHYTVTYDCNSGNALVQDLIDEYDSTSVPPAGGATYDSPYTFWIVDNTCSKSGYTATGWECKDANSTVINQTSNATAWTVDSNVTCYAQWNAKPVTLNWNRDGGDWPLDENDDEQKNPNSCYVGTPNGIAPLYKPTKRGYTFRGWNIQ